MKYNKYLQNKVFKQKIFLKNLPKQRLWEYFPNSKNIKEIEIKGKGKERNRKVTYFCLHYI